MDWFALTALVAFSLFLVVSQKGRGNRWVWALACGIAALTAVGALGWVAGHKMEGEDRQFLADKLPHQGRPDDGYVTADRCAACHPDQYHSWHQSFHRTMTQIARPDTVRGNFENARFELEGKTYRLERRGAEFWAELPNPEWVFNQETRFLGEPPQVWRRVGMLTGSHHMQVYWIPTDTNLPTNLQLPFPFAYLFDDQKWVPLNDTFLRDPNLHSGQGVWNMICIDCHATAGQSKLNRQNGLMDTRVGEFGIACEACHGPGAEHVRANSNPARRYLLHQGGKGDTTIVNPARLATKAASQVCGRCHGITWIANGIDFRENGSRFSPGLDLNSITPVVQPTRRAEMRRDIVAAIQQKPNFLRERFWPDGMVRVSGRDLNGLIESPCYKKGELSCLSCHSMHKSDPVNQVAAGMESNEACFQCHKTFRANLAAHTHHAPDSSGSLCYNCHMARTTYGLLKAIRNHYIENPSAEVSARTGRPNGCNLCHLDRSLGWTDQHLSAWFGTKPATLTEEERSVSAIVLWSLRGDAGQRALAAWHLGWAPALKASGEKWEAPYLAQLLVDPYSAVRCIASHSLAHLPGFGDFVSDFEAKPEEREQTRERALTRWRKGGVPDRTGLELLTGADGKLQLDRVAELLTKRDNTSMDLQE